MQTLLEFIELADIVQLEKATNLLEFNMGNILNRAHNRLNPVKDFATQSGENGQVELKDDFIEKVDEAMKRLQAARTGLGLVNKLKDPGQRAAHKSRIMKNLNLLRMIVLHMEQELAKNEPKPEETSLDQREPVGNGVQPEPYMGGTEGMREDIDPKLVKAVKDLRVARKELEKNPFGKSKKKSKKSVKNDVSGEKVVTEAHTVKFYHTDKEGKETLKATKKFKNREQASEARHKWDEKGEGHHAEQRNWTDED